MPEEKLAHYAAMTEAALERYFPQEPSYAGRLTEACRYSLLAGGKRLRPALLLEFYRLCGGAPEDALPFACGLEMIHTYSLIHDDLPCMDDDDYRRGRLSNHKVYGEAVATLAGDALLNRAFEIMLSQTAVPADRAMAAAAYIGRCSGIFGMIGGQIEDLSLEGKTASESELLQMISKKTGALLRAACVGGCLLAGASRERRTAAEQYADALGLAFQIRDDLLDVIGDSAALGKATGSDEAKQKSTFVSLYGQEECQRRVDALTQRAVSAAGAFGDDGFLAALARQLARRDH